jgi:hypothetical protein
MVWLYRSPDPVRRRQAGSGDPVLVKNREMKGGARTWFLVQGIQKVPEFEHRNGKLLFLPSVAQQTLSAPFILFYFSLFPPSLANRNSVRRQISWLTSLYPPPSEAEQKSVRANFLVLLLFTVFFPSLADQKTVHTFSLVILLSILYSFPTWLSRTLSAPVLLSYFSLFPPPPQKLSRSLSVPTFLSYFSLFLPSVADQKNCPRQFSCLDFLYSLHPLLSRTLSCANFLVLLVAIPPLNG